MAGIKGLRFRDSNARRHKRRIDRGRSLDNQLRDNFLADCEARRAHVVRKPFGHGWIDLRIPLRFSPEECQAWYDMGFQVPLDLVPESYWIDDNSGLSRFGEEMLGDDF